MFARENGDHVRADLVCRIAVGRDAIGADDNRINLSALHYVTSHVVGDDRYGNVVFRQLPCGQSQSLEEWSRFIGDDRDLLPASRAPRMTPSAVP